ncbi:MAG: apolipoprotein N-acyltransferase [Candidatus Acidiferrum sp.]
MPSRPWVFYLSPNPLHKRAASVCFFLAALSGVLLALSYTGFYLTIFSWVCVGILLIAIVGARPGIAFGCGFMHAMAFVLLSVPWFAVVLYLHGGVSRAGGWGVLLLIAAAWGMLTGSFAWVVQRLSRRSMTFACAGMPFVWVVFEFLRGRLPEIGFPWNLLGYPAAGNAGLVQIASVTGIYGLSFLVAACNSLFAWSALAEAPSIRHRFTVVGTAVLVLGGVFLGGPHLVPVFEARHFARAVQLNFPEVDSFEANWFFAHEKDMQEIEQFSLAQTPKQPDLLIWPEAPAPFSYQNPEFTRRADALATRFGHPFLADVVEWKAPVDSLSTAATEKLVPYNSAVLIDEKGHRLFSYDKIHLVPFGEYEPFPLIHQVVKSVSDEVGGFRKGNRYTIGELPGGYKFGTFICYEAIFGGEVRKFAAGGAQLFINISNDGWFGRSAAADQHLQMARVRAVENRRWLLRVTNNGYTVSVDPYGRVFHAIPADVRGGVDLPYDFRTDTTIYTRYGDWFAWLCVLVSVILLGMTFGKKA